VPTRHSTYSIVDCVQGDHANHFCSKRSLNLASLSAKLSLPLHTSPWLHFAIKARMTHLFVSLYYSPQTITAILHCTRHLNIVTMQSKLFVALVLACSTWCVTNALCLQLIRFYDLVSMMVSATPVPVAAPDAVARAPVGLYSHNYGSSGANGWVNLQEPEAQPDPDCRMGCF